MINYSELRLDQDMSFDEACEKIVAYFLKDEFPVKVCKKIVPFIKHDKTLRRQVLNIICNALHKE